MAQTPEDKKPDFSNFPRGAIGIKGLPVGRNARLPSIRTPRDLTLGAQPKRTFTPNIPVRREKRLEPGKDLGNTSMEGKMKTESKTLTPKIPDRGRGRGKNKANIIQTEGTVFGDGIASSTSSPRAKHREAIQRSGFSSEKKSPMKIGKVKVTEIAKELDKLMRDDFIDDGDEDDEDETAGDRKPIIFPFPEEKKEDNSVVNKVKTEDADGFNNQNFAKEMGFDVKKIAKFIKKEKNDDVDVPAKHAAVSLDSLPQTKITELLKCVSPQLLFLRFPQCMTAQVTEDQQRGVASTDNDQKVAAGNVSSLPEGPVGKLQIMKSGRAQLVVGSLCYDLDSVSTLTSKHELVSIKADSDAGGGDVAFFGSLNKKLSFAPEVEDILSYL